MRKNTELAEDREFLSLFMVLAENVREKRSDMGQQKIDVIFNNNFIK